jgi:hypothetical protein
LLLVYRPQRTPNILCIEPNSTRFSRNLACAQRLTTVFP